MTTPSTRVLIVDDSEKTRDTLIELLRFDDIEVVGESTFGAAAYTWADRLDVDVVVMTIEEPVARSLRTVEAMMSGARTWPVVGVSSRGDRDTMRKAMVSGVRDYVVMPMPPEELRATIINVHHIERARRAAAQQGQVSRPLGTVITVAGFKGGIGKSTISSNVAVALAQQTKQHVALIDLDLQFGDAAVMLDIVPTTTIEHVAKEMERLDPQLLQGYLATHASRLKLLAAPATPEASDAITDETAGQILEMLAETNDFVVVDTAPHLDGLSVSAMDVSTFVLIVVVPEIPCLRRTKAALALMQSWGYSRDKVKLVVNRSHRRGAVTSQEIEQVLNYPVYAEIPDDRSVGRSVAIGTPVAMSAPKSRAGRAANDLARTLTGVPRPADRISLLRKRPSNGSPQVRPVLSAAPQANAQPSWSPPAELAANGNGGAESAIPWEYWPSESLSNGHGSESGPPASNGNGHRLDVPVREIVHAGESAGWAPLTAAEE